MKHALTAWRLSVISIAVASMIVFAALGSGCSKEKTESGEQGGAIATQRDPGDMVAKVNGKEITQEMVDREVQRLASTAAAGADPQQLASMRDMMVQQATENMINRMLLDAAAAKEGVSVSPEQLADKMMEIKSSFPNEQEFNQRVAMMGMTPAELEKEVSTGIKFEALLNMHSGDVKTPTEEEIAAFYETNRARFQQPDRVHARHILVSVAKEDTPEQKAEKRAKADAIRKELLAGADFAATAATKSDCPSKQQGGDLGFFGRGQMVPAFEQAAFALKQGELSDVVETDFGYHLISVLERQDAREVPLSEARQSIVGHLQDQQKQAAINTYIQDLRSAAKIDYAK
jgi:peptidyl-prolyl cis-trans isomerase C